MTTACHPPPWLSLFGQQRSTLVPAPVPASAGVVLTNEVSPRCDARTGFLPSVWQGSPVTCSHYDHINSTQATELDDNCMLAHILVTELVTCHTQTFAFSCAKPLPTRRHLSVVVGMMGGRCHFYIIQSKQHDAPGVPSRCTSTAGQA
jgi:hypothetical protein